MLVYSMTPLPMSLGSTMTRYAVQRGTDPTTLQLSGARNEIKDAVMCLEVRMGGSGVGVVVLEVAFYMPW
jgi:hypothetical protein